MLTLACTSRVTPASADGDPASDVLATQSLFMPQDAGVPAGEERRLVEVLSEATRSGHPIRVAVIASAADLGSVTGLWRAPEAYAEFLGEELRLLYTGPLLVVMPDGFGLAGFGASTASYSSQLTRSRMALGAGRVGVATVDAVRRLAGAGGDPLALPPLASGGARPSPTDYVAWLVFVSGMILVGIAWTVSLRARPPTRRSPQRRS